MSLATLLQTNEIPLARDNGPLTVLSAEQTANAAQHVAPVEGAYGLGINNFWTSMLGSSSSTAQPQVPIDLKSNVFGAMNPFEAIGTGRSFLKHFDALFINHLDCPEGFGSDLVMDVLPAVHVRGASPLVFQVGVEIVGNCIRLSTGWSLFVESEKIVSGDYGLFVLSAPHTLEMKLFDSNGNEKPMSARPPAWNLFVAYGEEDGHPNPPPAQDDVNLYAGAFADGYISIVPEHLLGMQYELGPKLMMTGPLMQALSDVWINFETHFPLYACKLNHSHVNGGTFYFTTNFSNTLPTGHKIVTLSHPADDHLFAATLRKRTGNTGLALISGPGWKDFVKHYGFQLGDLVVLSIRLYLGRLLVRVFRLPIV
ncbi:uncharacterized protein LOC120666136 isoform X1 [Panicum virgatum]|uniref:uncharacterized protein LOC120666136 isoform X1 n=1 Tax=Panicum virgatum TaxID=38727 RepID=UPI0019D625AF|nr:uncharacterized protein LOC120666136 isoform X1 [Panicum virgatum]